VEGFVEVYEKIVQLKLPAPDEKMRVTDCADMEILLRVVQSIPSPKAEPFKRWLAEVGVQRIQETVEPGRAVKRAVQLYRDQKRPDDWISNRLQNASAESELHGEWDGRGVKPQSRPFVEKQMHKEALGVTPEEHRELKKLGKDHELPDHMDGLELAIDTLGKEAATALIRTKDTRGYETTRDASIEGAEVAGGARRDLEEKLGRRVVSSHNFLPKPAEKARLR
jgi:DNA-damage-inducible protein D